MGKRPEDTLSIHLSKYLTESVAHCFFSSPLTPSLPLPHNTIVFFFLCVFVPQNLKFSLPVSCLSSVTERDFLWRAKQWASSGQIPFFCEKMEPRRTERGQWNDAMEVHAHFYILASTLQWKPFWLATQLCAQNNWLGSLFTFTLSCAHGPNTQLFIFTSGLY